MSKLHIVSTPIGNMGDITLRALETLKEVEFVYAEDTRVTRKVLSRYDIHTPLRSYREMQPRPALERTIQEIITLLHEGKALAYTSDAGTPGVSDPGDYLVRRVREAGFEVVTVPGASALAAIMSVSGLGCQHPLFEGFLPHKKGRQTRLKELAGGLQQGIMDGVVFYESPERILRLFAELLEWNQPLSVCVGRELTKQFEEVVTGSLEEVQQEFAARPTIKGEIVLLVTTHA
ncbi:MAG TPA: 16S rRNA (cytidine(1402)-2'-O)-methyltransferase [Verrucomicrobiae bacterium]|nr:16S rRNA (cytidine(1402)-2'-O)-methyltransferase [Verrucomicrobiae bacterium]